MYNPEIVSRIWRGFGSIEIIKDLAPGTDREERELFDAIAETRAAIEILVRDLPPIVEMALRQKFTVKQVFDTVVEKGEGLIPPFHIECLIGGVQKKLHDEGAPAREAAEKAASEARKIAIQKQIDDAKEALRNMGAQL